MIFKIIITALEILFWIGVGWVARGILLP